MVVALWTWFMPHNSKWLITGELGLLVGNVWSMDGAECWVLLFGSWLHIGDTSARQTAADPSQPLSQYIAARCLVQLLVPGRCYQQSERPLSWLADGQTVIQYLLTPEIVGGASSLPSGVSGKDGIQWVMFLLWVCSVLWHCWLADRKGIQPVKTSSSYHQRFWFAKPGVTLKKLGQLNKHRRWYDWFCVLTNYALGCQKPVDDWLRVHVNVIIPCRCRENLQL